MQIYLMSDQSNYKYRIHLQFTSILNEINVNVYYVIHNINE